MYRFVQNDPPGPMDFRSYVEEGRADGFTGDKMMRAHGLSVDRVPGEAKKKLARFKRINRKAWGAFSVFSGTVTPQSGVMMPYKPTASHCTWWVPADVRPWVDIRFTGA